VQYKTAGEDLALNFNLKFGVLLYCIPRFENNFNKKSLIKINR